MKVCTLFSGSKGNATLVTTKYTKILIDCGVCLGALATALNRIGESPREINAILVTHEHGDHCSAVGALQTASGAEVYVHEKGASVLADKSINALKPFSGTFCIRDVNVNILSLKHDATHTTAFRLSENNCGGFAAITDTGVAPAGLAGFVKGADLVLIESNHDADMLLYGEYPISLKKRILSENGHLSNAQCAETVRFFPSLNVKRIILGHLSEVNNTAELAFAASLSALSKTGAQEGKDIILDVIPQGVSGEYLDLSKL